MKQIDPYSNRNSSRGQSNQYGHVALAGIVLMVLLVVGVIGFTVWTATQKSQPVIRYTPPAVTADDPLSEGKSTKEIVQDVKILEAGIKRADGYQAAAEKVLNDAPQSSGLDPTATTVEQERLSQLQTAFIAECSRRIDNLTKSQPLLEKITSGQRPVVEQLINQEITALNGMKARVTGATDANAFAGQQQQLNQEYNAYLLALAQLNLLVWADDQAVLNDKFNVVGGKFQERVNEASNNGKSTALSQTLLNSYQANKVTAKDLTAKVIKVVPTIKPGEHNSNRAVLKTYYDQLNTAHTELTKALDSAKKLAVEVQKFDLRQ